MTPEESASRAAAALRDSAISGEERKAHGVVHTPVLLCRYVVHRLHRALQKTGLPKGLRTPRLTVIDPACGTGAFFASLLGFVGDAKELTLRGIDLDAQALAAAQEAIARPPGVHLDWVHGDALAMPALFGVEGPLALIGNPPWAGRSASKADTSEAHLEAFRRDADGHRLGERKIGVLSDSYVRFFAWAHAAFEERPGAFAFVSNASFLDGPVHRGMRSALHQRFPHLELTDFGGSSLIAREKGTHDENVFGVRPGVVVAVGAKGVHSAEASVSYARILGTKEEKLASVEAGAPSFDALSPRAPGFLFVPTQGAPFPADWASIADLVPFHREGVQTNRDAVLVDADRDALLGRMQAFALGMHHPRLDAVEKTSGHYDPELAREVVRDALERDPSAETWILPIDYRPFDRRFFVSLSRICHRPRHALQSAVANSSFSLVTVRKDRGGRPWNHVWATDVILDNCLLSARSSCRARAFPTHGADGAPNLSDEGRRWASQIDPGAETSAEKLLLYALAWLGAPSYQQRFGGVLRHDYPHIPPPGEDAEAFVQAGEAYLKALLAPGSAGQATLDVGHWVVEGPAPILLARDACDALVQGSAVFFASR